MATAILRDMVYSLLENGIKKQDVAAALNTLTGEAAGDEWKKGLETRQRMRGGAR
jgi:hypothetical protein